MKRSTIATLVIAALLGGGLFATASASADRLEWRDRHQPRSSHYEHHRNHRLQQSDHRPRFRITFDSHRDNYRHRQGHYRQPVTCPPQPRYHRKWVPGHYTNRYCPPQYRTYYDACGTKRRVLVRHGGYERVWVPGRWVTTRY